MATEDLEVAGFISSKRRNHEESTVVTTSGDVTFQVTGST